MSHPPWPEHGHSALEVSHEGDALKEVVPSDTPKEVVPSNDAPEVWFPNGHGNYQPYPDTAAAPAAAPGPKKRTIFGLSRRTLIISVVVAVIVVATIVGGVVGGVLRNRTDDPPPSPTPTSAGRVLDVSKLAASNYTDDNGFAHRSVYFQDAAGALIVRIWDAQNTTWQTVNLTQQHPGANVMRGTPLASASLELFGPRVHLWCLLADRTMHTYYWVRQDGDPTGTRWTEGNSIANSFPVGMEGTSLASAWQRPAAGVDGVGSWIVAFQNQSGEVAIVNYTGADTTAVSSNAVAPLSSLALTPQLVDGGLTRLSLVYESNGKILNASFTERDWDTDSTADIFSGVPAPSPKLQLAATAFDRWNQFLYLALLPNGTVAANRLDSDLEPIPSVEFSGGPKANFSAIATTSDAMFYGISNGSVLEYSIDTSNPQTFHYSGVVF